MRRGLVTIVAGLFLSVTSMVGTAQSSSASTLDSSGATGCEYVFVSGSGLYVNYIDAENICSAYYGHHHIWLTNGWANANQPDNSGPARFTVNIYLTMPGSTRACAQGWKSVSGGYADMGLPCVNITP